MKKSYIILPLVIVVFVTLAVMGRKGNAEYQHDSGFVFGTSYNITYQSDKNMKEEIEKVLQEVDNSLSPFNEKSVITKVNNNQPVTLSEYFLDVFNLAKEVNKESFGAFDITVAPLVNAWGFGFKNGKMPSETQVDSIRSFIGFKHVELKDGKIVKDDPRVMLDCSAIAKGFGVDMVAKRLDEEGIENYMVEIGGEIVAKGTNDKQKPWNIGVTKPTDDSLSVNQELQTVLSITNTAMATSGNYRNFYYKGGKKYAHTIDPMTGYPVQHNILSATVLGPTCAMADAYATSFMVLGLEKAKQVLAKHKELQAYFIYNDEKGQYAVWFSPELKSKIKE